MKETKFRFWHRERHIMSPPLTLRGIAKEEFMILEGSIDEYDALQYTGLRDSKGVEIYEGDVVDGKGEYSTRLPQPVIWWDMGWYAGRIEEGHRWVTSLSAIEQPEVIGNIHDNPLEDKSCGT